MISYLKEFEFYGKCIELSAGGRKLIVTVDVGPRIVYYGDDEHNIFFLDKENSISQKGEFFDSNFKKGECWKIYGGHRLWRSPEDMRSYAPDNYPVSIEVSDSGVVTLTSSVEKLTGIQKTIVIQMDDNGDVTVTHSFTNKKSENEYCSLWALSVLKAGGVAICPVGHEETGLLANRNFVYWSYCDDHNDDRYKVTREYFSLKQDVNCKNAFKVGIFNPYGKQGYYVDGGLFVKSFTPSPDEIHPDCNCNLESYTSNLMLELESLSPLYNIAPGDTVSHVEHWKYIRAENKSNDEIYALIMKS